MAIRILISLAALHLSVSGAGASQLAEQFAHCTGRLSAEVEHQWLFSDPRADRTEALRDNMRSLLASATTLETSADVMSKVLNAKVAHKRLLTSASFAEDRAVRDRSARRAEVLLSGCLSFLLG